VSTGEKSLLGPLLHNVLEKHPSFSANPLGDWCDLAGEQLARYSRPVSLKNKVLVIAAYDSVWMHHLEINKEDLLKKINSGRSEPIVEKISIRVGVLPPTPDVINPNHRMLEKMAPKRYRPGKRKKTPLRPLTPEEKDLLKNLPDPDLRAIGERLLRRIPIDTE
jgi:hypothetical protein